MSVQILVVDDDIALAKTLARLLAEGGYEALLAHTAEDGLQLALTHRPALALLDVMVPQMGGWALCQRLRTFSDAPILFLTALGDVADVVRGLELGADDYLVKPVVPAEFLARIKARLRRPSPLPASSLLSFGNGELLVDLETRQVRVQNRLVELTPREFELLAAFVVKADQVVTAADLVNLAWGWADEMAVDTVKTYIHYLRKKIEADPAAPRWIQTVRGVGYRFVSG
jgi:DNA-binding response OmpR family regulator